MGLPRPPKNNYTNMSISASSGSMAEAVDPRYDNERFLLRVIREKLNISDDDMRDISVVRAKVRDSKLNEVLEYGDQESING